jgi:hypothetical protein
MRFSGADFEPGVAQNWAPLFVSEETNESNSLKISGEPGRTRTCNPLIKSSLTDVAAKEDKPLSSAKRGKVRQNPQPRRNRL